MEILVHLVLRAHKVSRVRMGKMVLKELLVQPAQKEPRVKRVQKVKKEQSAQLVQWVPLVHAVNVVSLV